MPFPVGHTLAGCGLALVVIPPDAPHAWQAWALCLVSANLPDLDFLPGFLAGKPLAFHRGPSHSLAAGFLVALLGASVLPWMAMPWLTRAALLFLAYTSHVILDYFCEGGGVLWDWPISRRRWSAAHPWFPSVSLGNTRQSFSVSLASREVLRATSLEVRLLGPGVAILGLARSLAVVPVDFLPF